MDDDLDREFDRELATTLAQWDARDDQEWAAGVEWLNASSLADVLAYRGLLARADAAPLIEAMRTHPEVAEVTQRLASLALDEIVKRTARALQEEEA